MALRGGAVADLVIAGDLDGVLDQLPSSFPLHLLGPYLPGPAAARLARVLSDTPDPADPEERWLASALRALSADKGKA